MKTTITHCVTGAKLSIEWLLVEKPAVGIVVSACANAWNGVISRRRRTAPSPNRIRNRRAVSAM